MWHLTKAEEKILGKLSTPIKIQDYLDKIPMNWEKRGETHFSPRRVLREKKAHCFEGALLAAAALWYHDDVPLIMDLTARRPDDDHVIALYNRNGYWGAISKTNHATIRFRDPVYKTLRELALSYFHEWFMNANGEKTLIAYSDSLNLKTLGTSWVTSEKELWKIDRELDRLPNHPIFPKENRQYIRKADKMELKAGRLIEWTRSDPRT